MATGCLLGVNADGVGVEWCHFERVAQEQYGGVLVVTTSNEGPMVAQRVVAVRSQGGGSRRQEVRELMLRFWQQNGVAAYVARLLMIGAPIFQPYHTSPQLNPLTWPMLWPTIRGHLFWYTLHSGANVGTTTPAATGDFVGFPCVVQRLNRQAILASSINREAPATHPHPLSRQSQLADASAARTTFLLLDPNLP